MTAFLIQSFCCATLLLVCCPGLAHEVQYTGPAKLLHKHKAPVSEPAGPSTAGFRRAYAWGYFGAQPGRYKVYHRGYYGEYFEWGYRRSY